jgi:hypothetical protein
MPDKTPKVLSFDEAIKEAGPRTKTLLLGNGFSVAQAGNQFAYETLLEKSGLADTDPVRNIFKIFDTFDFEKVMRSLEDAAQIEQAYGEKDRSKKFLGDAIRIRDALIQAVHAVHPGVQFDIPEIQRNACAVFLRNFDSVFTLSYDLLLYWVIVHAVADRFSDGFSHGDQIDGFREYSPRAPCNTHYLHGALHLFLGPRRETWKRVVTNDTIINDITDTIKKTKQLPLFVAEGSTSQKLARINSVPYLFDCYRTFQCLGGSIFVFGHSARDEDRHIYDAIFGGEIDKVFFCVHNPEDDWLEIRKRLAAFNEINKKVEVSYVDAATAKVWG